MRPSPHAPRPNVNSSARAPTHGPPPPPGAAGAQAPPPGQGRPVPQISGNHGTPLAASLPQPRSVRRKGPQDLFASALCPSHIVHPRTLNHYPALHSLQTVYVQFAVQNAAHVTAQSKRASHPHPRASAPKIDALPTRTVTRFHGGVTQEAVGKKTTDQSHKPQELNENPGPKPLWVASRIIPLNPVPPGAKPRQNPP